LGGGKTVVLTRGGRFICIGSKEVQERRKDERNERRKEGRQEGKGKSGKVKKEGTWEGKKRRKK
jgi:hypothetical protein